MRFLVLLALLAAPTPAPAQTAPPAPAAPPPIAAPQPLLIVEPVAMMVAAFDSDGDGTVTRAEYDAGVARSWDGFVRAGEEDLGYLRFADWSQRWLGDRSALPGPFDVDANRDNRITRAELIGWFAGLWTRLDTDQDGRIVRADLVRTRPVAAPFPPRRRR